VVQGDEARPKARAKQNSDVRFSDRGFAYAETGNREFIGYIPLISASEKLTFPEIPRQHGILIYNRTNGCLELSDPVNEEWICFSGSVPPIVSGTFASHLGSNDGDTNGLLQNPVFITGCRSHFSWYSLFHKWL